MRFSFFTFVFLFFLVEAAELRAFTVISNAGRPAVWADRAVTYELYNIPKNFEDPIRDSFEAWRLITGVDLSFTEVNLGGPSGARQGRNFIRWVESGWNQLSFRPPSNALAVTLSSFNSVTGEINYADIYFNAENLDWAVVENEDDLSFIDVQNISTHEVGHMLGLDHSSVSFFESDPDLFEATMFYASGRGETSRREPKIDDERGIRSLYPASPTAAPTIDLVEQIEQIGDYAVYRIRGENFNELTSFVLSTLDYEFYDVVARYRMIFSSTEAEVEFDLGGFGASEATIVAFNHPESLFNYSLDLASGQATANSVSSKSGGGCSASPQGGADSKTFFFFASVLLGLMMLRRKKA